MDGHRLGKLIDGFAERDATHIAIAPMTALKTIRRGEYIKLSYGTIDMALPASSKSDAIGIADPFLDDEADETRWGEIEQGARFWAFLWPGSIIGLRHHWEHPAFMMAKPSNDHELWLRQFAERWAFNYDDLISMATNPGASCRYITADGVDCHSAGDLGEDHDLFWFHIEGMTGKSKDELDAKHMGWSCSC